MALKLVKFLINLNDTVGSFLWSGPGLVLLIGSGIYLSLKTRFFQLTRIGHWLSKTAGSIIGPDKSARKSDSSSISQFQSLCTVLAATLGVGNIAGISTAISFGGPGAIFWMWIAAFFGMITAYCENVLGIFYRRRNERGEWSGGAMYYLRDGLGGKRCFRKSGGMLAALFAFFCVLSSLGMGNASQINSIVNNITEVFSVVSLQSINFLGTDLYAVIIGAVLMLAAGIVILGGIKRVASVTEKVVPFMVITYIAVSVIIIFLNISSLPKAFLSIFRHAFGGRAAAGGIAGHTLAKAVNWGLRRGVFSNEAGLGSSVAAGAASNVREPAVQGMWGIFEVFADTIVVCTLTALVILSSGLIDLESGRVLGTQGSTLVSQAFALRFGKMGGGFIAVAVLLFAFSTVLGWSYFGEKAWEYLFGTQTVVLYKVIFVVFIMSGATMSLDLAWSLSDTINALMMLPNLVGVLGLSGVVIKITDNYCERTFQNKKIRPLLSYDCEIQRFQEASYNFSSHKNNRRQHP